jgi:hypothetical protein
MPSHEAQAAMNDHSVDLVFADPAVAAVDAGYAPFVVAARTRLQDPTLVTIAADPTSAGPLIGRSGRTSCH